MPTLGRKNFMFCGNHEAAENAAIMYSVLGCCKTCGVNPRQWLTDVLTRIPVYNNDYSLDLADLLPHNWKVSKNGQKSSTASDNCQGLSEKSVSSCQLEQIPRKSNLCRNVFRIFKTTIESTGLRHLYQADCLPCDLLQKLRYVSQSFRKIINGDNQGALNTWLSEVKQLNIKTINSFVRGVNQDKEAVLNAIQYPWTNGLVEGNVND